MIYLDHNATTPLAPEVLAAMLPVLEKSFGNPSSIHSLGREARAVIDDARDRLAAVLGARPHEIIFTGGGTEADNLAVLGLARRQVRERGAARHVITASTEHHAILHAAEALEGEGFAVTRLPVDSHGLIDPDELRSALSREPKAALVSIMSANNETGTIQPLGDLATVCREAGVVFHSDMIQSFGKLPVSVRDRDGVPGPDAISLAAHKFYGPKGVGALWVRSGISIDRIAHGGSHENERRPGTENAAAIAGLACAAELAVGEGEAGMKAEQTRQAALRDALWAGIAAAYPRAMLNGHSTLRLGNTLNVSFPGLDGEGLLINFDLEGICVSSGSACMVGSILPSHVLLAMGVDPEAARSAVRFSLGKSTTEKEIKKVVESTPAIVDRLQAE